MNIFISSVIKGMKSDRNSIIDVIKSFGFEYFASEHEGSSWDSSAEKCLDEIRKCDIFVGLYGNKYGFVPSKNDIIDQFDGVRSIAEIEFAFSRKLSKPTLLYIRKEVEYEQEQKDFLSEIRNFFSGLFMAKYKSTEEIGPKFKNDLSSLLTQLIRGNYRYPEETIPQVLVYKDSQQMYKAAAEKMLTTIEENPWPCISVSAGLTTAGVYNSFVNNSSLKKSSNIHHATFVVQTEYIGYSAESSNSCQSHINNSLLSKLPVQNKEINKIQTIFLPGYIKSGTFESACTEIDGILSHRIIHLSILGVSPVGEVLCIDPEVGKEISLLDQTTSVSPISNQSLQYMTPKPAIPYVIMIGIGNLIKRSERIIIVAEGKTKAEVIRKLCFGPITSEVPVTLLRMNKRLEVLIDAEAGTLLPKTSKYGNIRWIE